MPRTRSTPSVLLVALVSSLALVAALGTTTAGADEVDLSAYWANHGITQDPLTPANYDGGGWAYSSLALLLAGVRGGDEVTADGMTFTWPDTQSGEVDNMESEGQAIPIFATSGETRVGLMGSSTNGPASGDFVLNYTYVDEDGELQEVDVAHTVEVSDWTLNAGNANPSPGNTIAITSDFRATQGLQPEFVDTHVFVWSIPIDQTLVVDEIERELVLQGITFPQEPRIHVFSMVID